MHRLVVDAVSEGSPLRRRAIPDSLSGYAVWRAWPFRGWETLTHTVDRLNTQFGNRVVTLGEWTPPPGGFTGGKIAFTRIPSAEDFW